MGENGRNYWEYYEARMIGVFIICFLAFPIAVFINSHKSVSSDVCLDRQDSNVIKGIATSFVILAHLISYLENSGKSNGILSIFTVMGGMGVLLFFFLSGYGLYKGYEGKKIDKSFWKKRLIYMYIPSVIIQFVFYFIEAVINQQFDISQLIVSSLFGAWFIDVILIQYLTFFIAWIISKGKPKLWIAFSLLVSVIVALVLMKLEFNARWYNGLMLFPFGMLIAYMEKELVVLIKKRWSLCFILNTILFLISGIFFTLYKQKVSGIDIVKTFSGMCLSMMICISFLKIKFTSKIMQFIGKRSLYFYLIHLNLLRMLSAIDGMDSVYVFYYVLILTFLNVELFYWVINAKLIWRLFAVK